MIGVQVVCLLLYWVVVIDFLVGFSVLVVGFICCCLVLVGICCVVFVGLVFDLLWLCCCVMFGGFLLVIVIRYCLVFV